ncbi:MAG TPA: hypothetical protein VHN74_04420 [Candidatus Angelobacter sp.]|jgi:transposase-like protein|nr:hypothetical protein [Candidatus Angelobacter sp.]
MSSEKITFIECPFGDTFPVRKTSDRCCGIQVIACPECGHSFELMLEETVERLSGLEGPPRKQPQQSLWRGAAATAIFA